ncbi:RNA-directed DNA polymerase, eukaryota [Tanacetum coccineum]
MNILRCFSLLSGMSINIQKSHLLGVGIPDNCVAEAAKSIGCLIMKAPFKYLGILVGDNMSSKKAWDETINKMKKRLSRWKLNTLSVGGRLTLLKSVLGSTPIYNMSIFKVPKSVLNYMESLRRNFFNGIQEGDRKIAWVKWSKVLASKKFGGLGVSSFFALNRALLFKWVWRYLSHDNSLWSRIISALHGLNGHVLSAAFNSTWSSIITEVNSLKVKGVDLISHCKIRVGKGTGTSFWKDLWIGDNLLKLSFPRLFALEENKDISVADKMNTSISSSFRRHVRGGVESQQLDQLSLLLDTVILSNMDDRWFWDLNGDGVFQVKDVRSMLDEAFLPKMEVPTRWIKSIPIKVNVFAWKLYLDRLPTRSNLSRRNVSLPSLACPLCDHVLEDSSHLFFGCSVAKDIQKLICRWWNLDVHPYESYEDWLSWFKSIRLVIRCVILCRGCNIPTSGIRAEVREEGIIQLGGGHYEKNKDFVLAVVELTLRVTINNGKRREVKYRQSQEVLVDIPENLVEDINIVAEHGLSSKNTQSPGGSSDTSKRSENSESFEESGRSDEGLML